MCKDAGPLMGVLLSEGRRTRGRGVWLHLHAENRNGTGHSLSGWVGGCELSAKRHRGAFPGDRRVCTLMGARASQVCTSFFKFKTCMYKIDLNKVTLNLLLERKVIF